MHFEFGTVRNYGKRPVWRSVSALDEHSPAEFKLMQVRINFGMALFGRSCVFNAKLRSPGSSPGEGSRRILPPSVLAVITILQ